MCKKCKRNVKVDANDLTPEAEEFLKNHPSVKAYMDNQIAQAERNGTLELDFDKEKAIEVWDRVTKDCSVEDRDTLANVFSVLLSVLETLNNPAKMLEHIHGKVHEQMGIEPLMAVAINGKTGETKLIDLSRATPDPSAPPVKTKMTKEEIEELFSHGIKSGKGGNA